jgi:hypothetical protein
VYGDVLCVPYGGVSVSSSVCHVAEHGLPMCMPIVCMLSSITYNQSVVWWYHSVCCVCQAPAMACIVPIIVDFEAPV